MKWFIFFISLAIALGITFWDRGGFVHTVVGTFLIIFLTGPALIVAIVSRGRGQETGGAIWRRTNRIAAGVCLTMLFLMVLMPLGWWLRGHDIDEAIAYCDALKGNLTGYRQKYGKYPDVLSFVCDQPPRLFREAAEYERLDPNTYEFRIAVPGSWPKQTYYIYNSREDIWKEPKGHGRSQEMSTGR